MGPLGELLLDFRSTFSRLQFNDVALAVGQRPRFWALCGDERRLGPADWWSRLKTKLKLHGSKQRDEKSNSFS
jgi:hypothetical protein